MKKFLLAVSLVCLFQVFMVSCDQSSQVDVMLEQVNESYYIDKAVVINTVVDVFEDANINSRRLTQAIFNQKVSILEERDGWIKVKLEDGYTGWLRSRHIDGNCNSIMWEKYSQRLIVTGKTKKIYSKIEGGATLKDVVMGTELYVKSIRENYYEVALPWDMTGWIDRKDTIVVSSKDPVTKTSSQDFITTVKKFVGTPYLLGGISSWEGIDCTGLIYICSRINGANTDRAKLSLSEYVYENNIGIGNIKPGDIVFFADNKNTEDFLEIGVYIGDMQFIYASKSRGTVIISDFDEERYKDRLVGVKRLFD
ncbi:UNVERIFIED_CONTAM: Cell wall-associated hydrolases (invasion-associated proteins) [Acetivibrio alkalicellulosi]